MMKNKKVHLARFIALYLTGCIFTGGAVCHANNIYGNGNDEVMIVDGETYDFVYGSNYNSTVDSTSIRITGGTIHKSVYGSGTGSTVKNAIIGISGGSIVGNIEAGNVSGQKLLYFTGGSPTVGGDISGFDSVIITDGIVTLKGSLLSASDVSINENGLLAITKDMKFTLDSTNGSLNIAGELFIPSAITLTIEDGTVSTQPTGMITLGVDNNHSNPGKIVLKNNANFAADATLNVNINLSLDELLKMSGDEIQAILSQALGSAVSSVDIGNGSNAEYSYIKDANGKIIGVRPNSSAFDTYLGIRQANAHIAHSVMDSVHERNAALRTGAHSDDFWVNMRGGKSDINSKYGTASLKSQYYQLRYDWDLSDSDSARAVGVCEQDKRECYTADGKK